MQRTEAIQGEKFLDVIKKIEGMTLVTRNIKHYPMKDVEIIKPY